MLYPKEGNTYVPSDKPPVFIEGVNCFSREDARLNRYVQYFPIKEQKSMQLRPLFDRIIVKRDPAAAVTEGGILIPEKGRPKPRRGTVIAVGPGKQLDNGRTAPMMVQEGDRVMFGPYAGNEFDPRDEDLLSMGQSEVIGVLEEE